MAKDTALAVRPMASESLATFIGMDKDMMLDTIRVQCFRGDAKVTDEQVAAFISIAVEMKVNPLLPGMLYAYPSNGGIIPIMGPDGVYKKLTEHPEVSSWEVEVLPEDVTKAPTHAIARIYRKGVDKPITYTALLSEWKIGSNPNWNNRPRHMLQMRALKHAARQIIHGLPYDDDDRHIIIDGEKNITGSAESQGTQAPVERADPGKLRRGKSGPSAAGGTTIEAEIVPPKAEGEAPPTENPPAETPEPKLEVVKELGKDQKLSFVGVKVVSAAYEDFGKKDEPKHGAKVTVEGPFTGLIYDLEGGIAVAVAGGKIELQVRPIWTVGDIVNIDLVGKFSKVQKVVLPIVEKVSPGIPDEGDGLGIGN